MLTFKEHLLIEAFNYEDVPKDLRGYEAFYRSLSKADQKELDIKDAAVFDRFYGLTKKWAVKIDDVEITFNWRFHSKARYYRRVSLTKLPHPREVYKFLNKYAKQIPDAAHGEIVIYSRSTDFSGVFDVFPPKIAPDGSKYYEITFVTLFPKGRKAAKEGSPLYLVEWINTLPYYEVD